ncbi:hypothetical protein JTB14_016190 [Gonioctena quinquepunctata]|nr:hypothetical protein JTB14_016190 [Gonioctena quinquepunctata]
MTSIMQIHKKEKQQFIDQLRRLLKEKDIPESLYNDDIHLERFLYGADFDVEKAFKKIKMFNDLVNQYPEWFTESAPIDKKEQVNLGIMMALPDCDKEGRPIIMTKLGKIDVDNISVFDILALDDFWYEYILCTDPKTAAKGLSLVYDVKNYSFKMMKWLRPDNIRISLKKMEALPFKEIKFHVVNSSFLINTVTKIVWPFLPDSMKKRVKFHYSDWNSLYREIDREVLPPEYGGNKNLEPTQIYEKLYAKNDEIVRNFKLQRGAQ